MSVKVVTPRPTPSNGINTATDQYAKAQYAKVISGHLHVLAQDSDRAHDVVAIYAPGQWHYVSTDV